MTDPIATSINPEKGNTCTMQHDLQDKESAPRTLVQQIDMARQEKATLQDSVASRATAQSDKLERLFALWKRVSPLEELLQISDMDRLKRETRTLFNISASLERLRKEFAHDLEVEHKRVDALRQDNQLLRQMTVELTAHAEQEEEFISNRLLKRISGLKKEKGELLLQVEQEEEYLTNMLQKKLTQLQKEKIDLENALEQEQEFIVNKLQKQLDSLRLSQSSPVRSTTDTSPLGPVPMSPTTSNSQYGTSPSSRWISGHSPAMSGEMPIGQLDMLRVESSTLQNKAAEMRKEYLLKHQQCAHYKEELVQLRKQSGLSLDDLVSDDSLPLIFRSVPPSPGRNVRTQRSTSTSSLRSIASEKGTVPPLQLDNSASSSTQYSDGKGTVPLSRASSIHAQPLPDEYERCRSASISSSSGSNSMRRDGRRVSGNQFGLQSPPPQHPPQL